MRKSRKSDYIIMALICVLTLNIGNLIIRFYISSKDPNYLKGNNFSTFISTVNTVAKAFKIDGFLQKTINSLFPVAEVLNPNLDDLNDNEEDMGEFNEVDENHYDYTNDIIIESLDEYESLIIIKDSDGVNRVENIPEPLMLDKVKVDRSKPYILIYHTHATESYLLAKKDNYRSSDKRYNMINIGSIISTVLEANGHKVEHVETYHDLPSYNQSYARSYNTIVKKREESDNLKILLDIHRDAIAENSPNIESIKKKSKIEIDGKEVATFSLVVGPDSPNFDRVLSFAKYIKAVSDTLYPNLCTGIIIKPAGRYNQHISDYSALVEVGYNFNTLEEAKEGAKLVAEVLALAINSILDE
ncbi:MAG: stage II sporulation protein P [Tissierellia bacterium]|nr:stage II sporulation protein P [Tissierellia bacterium]